MKNYSLECSKGHCYDAWFPSSDEFDRLIKGQLLSCPVCGSTSVKKGLMKPQVMLSKSSLDKSGDNQPDKNTLSLFGKEDVETRQKIKKFREYIKKNAENVGEKFTDKVRQIHYNEVKPDKAIYGVASAKQLKELTTEGVKGLFFVPGGVDEKN